ncbi:MAG: FAD-dependent oxidoreductase [Alphaproteobacteria bacterium]|nr:FAD-dependent oxidoreductase [Alphaproteobacteria bacterium]
MSAPDLIVVGGGLAGLAAANRAAEGGLSALVMERGAEPDYFCNSRIAGGLLHVAFRDMTRPADEIRASVAESVGGDGGPATALSELLADDAGKVLAWLRAEGAAFVRGGAPEFMRWVMAPPRRRRGGLDWKGRGPDALLRRLTRNLVARGGELRLGSPVEALAVEDGRVVGVRTAAGMETARFVLIADGGFQDNPELVRRHLSPQPERLFRRGAGGGRGDGIAMAAEVGAATVGMDRFYGHLLGLDAFANDRLWPYPTLDSLAAVSLLVDGAGRRFCDEGLGGVFMANELARLADPEGVAVVFDDRLWREDAADNRYPPALNPSFPAAGGQVFEAPTVDRLAEILAMPALAGTVDAHNAGRHEPARTTGRFPAKPIAEPPFRAIRAAAGITYSMGGLAIDRAARVLDAGARPVPGLYAAGSAAGGLEGGPRAAYLGGLAKAVTTGLRAAEAMLAEGGG